MRRFFIMLFLLGGLALEAGTLTALERSLAIALLRSTKKMLNRNGIDRQAVSSCLERAQKVIFDGEGTPEDWAMVRRGIAQRREWQKIQTANNRAVLKNSLTISGRAGANNLRTIRQLDAQNILVQATCANFNPQHPFKRDRKNFTAVINHDFDRRYQKGEALPGMVIFLTDRTYKLAGQEYPVFVVGLDRARRLLKLTNPPEPVFELK